MKRDFKKSGKKFITGAVMMSALAAGAFASPVSDSTAGLFTSDADNIKSVTDWSEVDFTKVLVNAQYNYATNSYLDLTSAFKIKSLTLVPYFYGTIYSDSFSSSATSTKTETVDNTGAIISNAYSTSSSSTESGSRSCVDGPAGILFGFNNIGILASFKYNGTNYYGLLDPTSTTSTSSMTNSETASYDDSGNIISSTTITYAEGKAFNNNYLPKLEAGAKIKLNNITIKPAAGFGLEINTSGRSASATTVTTPALLTTTVTSQDYKNNIYYIEPDVSCSIDLAASNLDHIFTLGYSGTYGIYKTSYNDAFGNTQADNSIFKGKTVTTNTTTVLGITTSTTEVSGNVSDKTWYYSGYNLGYQINAPLTDKLTVSASLGINGIGKVNSTESYDVKTSNSVTTAADGTTTTTQVTENGASSKTETKYAHVTPSLKGGAVYFITPGKFAVNFGTNVTLPAYTYTFTKTTNPKMKTTYTKVTDSNSNTSTDSTQVTYTAPSETDSVTSSWGNISASIVTGFSWYLSNNVIIDTSLALNGSDGIFSGNMGAGVTVKF